MISTESFSKEWIEGVAQQYGYHDKELLEKVIRAFALLETLVDAGAPLTFKGGSSILLLLKDNLNRLSIDVDVICPPDTYILQYLNDLEKHGFLRAIPVRTEHAGKKLPANHSKVFYEVAFSNPNSNDAFIRLDVLYEDNPYTHTIAVPIDLPFLKQEGTPLMVNVPTKEDILGDKITAFGPNSIGIPYFKGVRDCSLDIMKQLFDISRLFDVVDDFTDTYASFRKVADVELGYRGMEGQIDRYYEDVRQTAINISTRGDISKEEFTRLQGGIRRLESYMYQQSYYIENATDDSAKAAYLTTCFERGVTKIEKFSPKVDVMDIPIDNLPRKIQKLRKSRPEAFYYWSKVAEMTELK